MFACELVCGWEEGGVVGVPVTAYECACARLCVYVCVRVLTCLCVNECVSVRAYMCVCVCVCEGGAMCARALCV